MAKQPNTSRETKPEPPTVIWGAEIEQGDYIKLPRVLLMLRRYAERKKLDLQPRHFYLMLMLAAFKFKNRPIRKYWEELAEATGFNRNTIRKWAYSMSSRKWDCCK